VKRSSNLTLFIALAFTALLFFVSGLPSGSLPGNGSGADRLISNLAHIPAYGLLTFLWLRSFNAGPGHKPMLMWLVIAGLILFAVIDEYRQSFVPGRTGSLPDFGLDMIGMVLGVVLHSKFYLRQKPEVEGKAQERFHHEGHEEGLSQSAQRSQRSDGHGLPLMSTRHTRTIAPIYCPKGWRFARKKCFSFSEQKPPSSLCPLCTL
jgi:VanZ family protein